MLIETDVRNYVLSNKLLFENFVATISTATKSEQSVINSKKQRKNRKRSEDHEEQKRFFNNCNTQS